MMSSKKTYFISDLHLDENHSKIADVFIHFLAHDLTNVEALYILGDFFEAWIGDDDLSEFHIKIISALKLASKKVPIFILHGNRDFLLGRKFFDLSGCKFLPDETVINIDGRNVLLMHGDTLCTLDKKYLQARKKLRNPWLQKLFLFLPLSLRRNIAAGMRKKSREYTQMASTEIMDVNPAEVKKILKKHAADLIIHGHTHRPGIHADRIVLAAWHKRGNRLEWRENGIPQLVDF